MKFIFVAVGKSNESYVDEGVKEFSSRISRYYKMEWKIISPPKNASALGENDLRKKEAELILSGVEKEDYLVALDEKGKELDSKGLAKFIQERANESIRNIIFLIGGAYGLEKSVLSRADLTFSLSKLTFPHQLVRLILAEQVYRACTIGRNEKYHH
jgi:23S rRNA (pseudouridine1915-N3)-methyltransferase